MLGYTIDKSIELLENRVKSLESGGGGGGGATNWNQLQNKPFNSLGEEFYNLDGELTIQNVSSDKIVLPDSEHYNWENVSEAVDGMNEELSHINDDIIDLTTEVNSLDETKQDILTYDNTERVIGTWFNKPLYSKCFTIPATVNLSVNSWKASGISQGSMNNIIDCKITNTSGALILCSAGLSGGNVVLNSPRAVDIEANCIMLLNYIKSTD